uniref:DDHD domain-containing protein n=1 Tax=Mesocestoides corti TaxID=53468 RepID=A0A5K3EY82_MESCO
PRSHICLLLYRFTGHVPYLLLPTLVNSLVCCVPTQVELHFVLSRLAYNCVGCTVGAFRPQDEQRVLPFSEKMSTTLEEYYRRTVESDSWGEKLLLPVDDNPDDMATYIFHNDRAMVQYRNGCFSSDSALNLGGTDGPSSFALCSYLYRGLRDDLESQIPDGDPRPIEHVVFVVHGIGSIYNMRGEGLIECVNDMRKTATSLLASHFADAKKGRVEFLPVRWHSSLHSETTGINNQLKRVTLRSIPKLRNYTNGTLTDILFYTSPKYCQHIIDTVASTIKHLRQLFLRRNPDFTGDFSVAGHSLGSVIVFDLLAHQRRTPSSTPSLSSFSAGPEDDDDWSLVDGTSPYPLATSELASQLTLAANLSEDQLRRVMNVVSGAVGVSRSTGVGLPMVNYPQLGFPLNTCFLLGSPLSIFLTARGTDRLPHDFRLPSCSACVNVFHPFDPVAYRLETMIVPDFKHCAVLMPHHKGRKRIHLELKDNIARVSADITSRVYQSLRSTWRTLQEFASAHTAPVETEASATDESDAIKQVLSRLSDGVGGESRSKGGCNENDDGEDGDEDNDDDDDETTDSTAFPSQLNQGRRIDYVLQEGPLESLNDYLFALSSHAVYWDSQDCVLFMLNQIFTNAAASMPTGVAAPHEHPSTSNQNALTVAGLRGTGTLTRRASPRGELVGATTPTGLQHSASIPVFGQTPSGLPHNHPQHYLPWQTPLFNPSPAPSTTSLRSQHAEPNRAGQSAFEADAPRFADEVKTASLIEIDLAP